MVNLGFDIGGTTVKIGSVDDNFNILKKVTSPTPFGDAEALVKLITDSAKELAGEEDIGVIGITVPGSVDKDGGIVDAWNLGLRNVPIKKMVWERVKASRIIVRNDADAAGVAEFVNGAMQGIQNGLLITLGTGFGGALIINGRLFHGGLDRGTEPGHAMLDRGGRRCACGHNGCIETLCSATALKRLGERAVEEKRGLIYERVCEGKELDARLVIDCAKEGDAFANELFDEYTDALSDAITSFVNVLDPEVIAVGGGVSEAGDFLLEKLRNKVPGRTFFGSCGRIVKAVAGNNAGIIGSLI